MRVLVSSMAHRITLPYKISRFFTGKPIKAFVQKSSPCWTANSCFEVF